jgi:hypothetical protein
MAINLMGYVTLNTTELQHGFKRSGLQLNKLIFHNNTGINVNKVHV